LNFTEPRFLLAAPNFANGHVMLARNLQRQADELPSMDENMKTYLKNESADEALFGLLCCPLAPDCCIHALEILQDINYNQEAFNSSVVPSVTARYMELADQIQACMSRVGGVGSSRSLWNEGKQWLSSPDPKNLHEGIRIFGLLVSSSPLDYWALIVYGSCLLASTGSFNGGSKAKSCREDVVNYMTQARGINARYPHGYCIGAQALHQLGRGDEAVALVGSMLDRTDLLVSRALHYKKLNKDCLQLTEPDHFQKILESLQVCANILLPKKRERYEQMRSTAAILWPQLESQLLQLGKQEEPCTVM
jgi:hypothetical protein